jgi:hypothetical protein
MKKNYIIHNLEGKILRTGFCQESDLKYQAQENEFMIEGKACDLKHKIKENRVVEKTDSEKREGNCIVEMDDQPASITNRQLEEILSRIQTLENN